MRLKTPGQAHLTYCTNVHPAESWDEVRAVLDGPVADVRHRVAPGVRFGVGLRLGSRPLRELMAPRARDELEEVLERHAMYVFSINAFPFGTFHGHAVKDAVYRPDWLEHARLAYTCRAADLLASLLPEDVVGSISTVPGVFAARAHAHAKDVQRSVAARLLAATAHLAEVERRTGRRVMLAVEPEPGCMLETAADAAEFFREQIFRHEALHGAHLTERTVRRHLGVCLDACHSAVAFELPRDALAALERDEIAIAKLQVSAAIQVEGAVNARKLLPRLDDGVYLHQTRVRQSDGSIKRYDDIFGAVIEAPEGLWRTHVHVPIDRDPTPPMTTTRHELETLIRLVVERNATSHLEVETYTWNVLPREARGQNLVQDIVRELVWARDVAEAA